MDQQSAPLQLNGASAYVNLSSAAKQPTGYFLNYDTNVAAVAVAVAAAGGNSKQGPFSSTGNDKFEWGNEINVGALPSPSPFQTNKATAPTSLAYTPIITGAPYSNFTKGQNFFNFTTAAIGEELGIQSQQQANNNLQNNGFAGTPQIYGDLYNAANSITANPSSFSLNAANVSQLSEEQVTQFAMDRPFQFSQFAGLNNHQNSGNKNHNTLVTSGNITTGAGGSQNSQNDQINQHGQFKLPTSSGVQNTTFPQSQFALHQQQQQQASANTGITPAGASQKPQSYYSFQKSQGMNGNNNNINNLLNNQQTNLTEQNENAPNNLNASSAPSKEHRKPNLQLLTIPPGNSINSNNQNTAGQSNNEINNNTILQNINHPEDQIENNMNAAGNNAIILGNPGNINTPNPQHPNNNNNNGQFQSYFASYGPNIGFSPFTPIQLQQLNNGPQSARMHYPRPQNSYDQPSFFFNTQSSFQQLPDSYALLTPGANNNGYTNQQSQQQQQRFFYPSSAPDSSVQAHFQQLSAYDQSKQFQQQSSNQQNHVNYQPQGLNQHQYQQQQQQIQQKQEHFGSFKNLLEDSEKQQLTQGSQQQQQQHGQQEHLNDQINKGNSNNNNNNNNQLGSNDMNTNNDKKKKPQLNLKIDVNVNDKDDEKNKVIEDEKDAQIMSMLQKNSQQNELNQNAFMNDANMSLIIEFYQKANPEKKQQLFEFISNQKTEDKEDSSKYKSQKILEYIITASTKRIGTLTLQQRIEKIQKYREKKLRRANTSLVKYKKQQIAVSKKPRDKNGKFLKQLDEEIKAQKKIKKKL